MKLIVVPIFQQEAFEFIDKYHRHHKKPVGCICCIACAVDDKIVGVVVVGRPHDRHQQDGFTACVTRLCTDGTPNACSMLYAAAWRAVKALGYRRLITYILKTEPGTSLKAVGWVCLGEKVAKSWNVKSRPRIDKHKVQNTLLFEAV